MNIKKWSEYKQKSLPSSKIYKVVSKAPFAQFIEDVTEIKQFRKL